LISKYCAIIGVSRVAALSGPGLALEASMGA
jgi:hypothetical protein